MGFGRDRDTFFPQGAMFFLVFVDALMNVFFVEDFSFFIRLSLVRTKKKLSTHARKRVVLVELVKMQHSNYRYEANTWKISMKLLSLDSLSLKLYC